MKGRLISFYTPLMAIMLITNCLSRGGTNDGKPPITQSHTQVTEHRRGAPESRITIMVYTDFQCPFCRMEHRTLQELLRRRSDTVSIILRHFPLPFHSLAMPSALAVECAADQGGPETFWNYADRLMERELEPELFRTIAGELQFDLNAFDTCLKDERYLPKIERHMNEGKTAGLRGTPFLIITDHQTGRRKTINGALELETLEQAIDDPGR